MIDQGQVIALIPARGRSKGVPRKNLRPLAGKPLIVHTIEVARACAGIDRVVVSTEDDEIAETALAAGAEVPFRRPAELATDDAPEWLVWRHAVETLVVDGTISAVASLSVTAPLRAVSDVEACLALLRDSDADLVLTVCASDRHPRFNMVSLEDGNRARLAMPSPAPIHRRQDAPPISISPPWPTRGGRRTCWARTHSSPVSSARSRCRPSVPSISTRNSTWPSPSF